MSALPTRACPQTCRPIEADDARREKGATAETYSGQMPTCQTELRETSGAARHRNNMFREPGTPHTDDRLLGRRAPANKTGFRKLSPNTRAAHP